MEPRRRPAAADRRPARPASRGCSRRTRDRRGRAARFASSTQTGSAPISITSASAAGRSSSIVVTPKHVVPSRCKSTSVPVNVMAGCRAIGSAPRSVSGSSTATPCAPLVWATIVPSRTTRALASPPTRPARSSSGTASSSSSDRAATCVDGEDVDARQQRLGPSSAIPRDRGDRDDVMTGTSERGSQHSPDPARADGTDRQPGRTVRGGKRGHGSFQSSRGYRTQGGYAVASTDDVAALVDLACGHGPGAVRRERLLCPCGCAGTRVPHRSPCLATVGDGAARAGGSRRRDSRVAGGVHDRGRGSGRR